MNYKIIFLSFNTKLYISSTLKTSLVFCSYLNIMDYFFTFYCFGVKIHSRLNAIFLLDSHANLPETSQFVSAQVTLLTIFFQVLMVLGMYNSVLIINGLGKWDGGIFNEETDPAQERSSQQDSKLLGPLMQWYICSFLAGLVQKLSVLCMLFCLNGP